MNGRYLDGIGAGFGGYGGHGFGLGIFGGVMGLIFTACLIAATVIAIILLIHAARNRGVEVQGGRLAAFWIVGIVLTPIMLALYVLTLKPEKKEAVLINGETVPVVPSTEGQAAFVPVAEPVAVPVAEPAVAVVETVAAPVAPANTEPTTPANAEPTAPLAATEAETLVAKTEPMDPVKED